MVGVGAGGCVGAGESAGAGLCVGVHEGGGNTRGNSVARPWCAAGGATMFHVVLRPGAWTGTTFKSVVEA